MATYCSVFESKVAKEVERRALLGVERNRRYKRRHMIRLIMRDGKCCAYCNTALRLPWEPGYRPTAYNAATYDHVQTRSSGGLRTLDNGKLACYICNNLRGTQSIEEYLARLAAVGGDPRALRAQVKKERSQRQNAKTAGKAEAKAKRFNRRVDATLQYLELQNHLALVDRFVHQLLCRLTSWSQYATMLV